eukprot:1427925-Rhodomonas_salina.4
MSLSQLGSEQSTSLCFFGIRDTGAFSHEQRLMLMLFTAFRSPLGAVAFTFEVVVTHWSFETCESSSLVRMTCVHACTCCGAIASKLCLLSAAISSLVINYVTAATYLNPDLEHGSFALKQHLDCTR